MAFRFEINKVSVGGPYSYTVFEDQDGKSTITGKADAGAALDGVKSDIVGLLNGRTVVRITGTVVTT